VVAKAADLYGTSPLDAGAFARVGRCRWRRLRARRLRFTFNAMARQARIEGRFVAAAFWAYAPMAFLDVAFAAGL